MAKFREKIQPLEVDITYFDSEEGHIAVRPDDVPDDPTMGWLLGTNEPVFEGDAIIFWGTNPDGSTKYSVMRADAVSAFFEPIVEAPVAPALPPPNPINELDLGEKPEGGVSS